jgi:putative NADH-flavin reductase
LLAAGHEVTGFARDPSKLSGVSSIRAVRGDVLDAAQVGSAVAGQEAVIVTLGNSQNPFAMMLGARRTTAADVCEVGTRHIVDAMHSAGVARLVVVTAFGIGDTRERLPLAFKLFYRFVLREHMADKEKQEQVVKASGLEWTLVQPVGLTEGPATGQWLADTTGVIRGQQISRADVAAFLVSLVGVRNPAYLRATVALSG